MESEYTSVQVVARHVPEPNGGPFASIQDAIAQGYDTLAPVTGYVQIGVMLDGAFIPVISEKASLVHDAIELAKANAAQAAQAQSDVAAAGQAPATAEPAAPTQPQG